MAATPSRRRGGELKEAIFRAVMVELAEVGYQKLTMDAVAARAHTSKPVLYRRWPGRAELVLATVGHNLPMVAEMPDTGDLRGDLITFLHLLAHRFDDFPGDAVHGLLLEILRIPDLASRFRDAFTATAPLEYLASAYGRALARGEINSDRITPRTIALPFTLLREEFVFTGAMPTDQGITAIIDEIVLPLLSSEL